MSRLIACAAVLLIGLASTSCPTLSSRAGSTGAPGDGMAFKRVVDEMRAGQPYYAAMGDTLRRGGYPTTSVFNWRTPLLYELLAVLPSWNTGRWMLTGLAAAAAVAGCIGAATASAIGGLTTSALWVGVAVMMSAPAAVGMGEAWAGCLIALSACAFMRGYRGAGTSLALTALAIRELAAPYCVACVAIAAYQRRWTEVAWWSGGGVAYLAAYWMHYNAVAAHSITGDLPQAGSWLAWGGVRFLLSTIRWHGGLLLLPAAWGAAALALIAAGTIARRAPLHVRISGGLYAALFLAVGQPFNDYWGFLAWPSWCLAAGFGVQGIVEDTTAMARRVAARTR